MCCACISVCKPHAKSRHFSRLELPTRVPAFIVQIHESNHKYSSAAAAFGASNCWRCESLLSFWFADGGYCCTAHMLQMVRLDKLQTSAVLICHSHVTVVSIATEMLFVRSCSAHAHMRWATAEQRKVHGQF